MTKSKQKLKVVPCSRIITRFIIYVVCDNTCTYTQKSPMIFKVLRSESIGEFCRREISVRADTTHEGPRVRAGTGELSLREIEPWILQWMTGKWTGSQQHFEAYLINTVSHMAMEPRNLVSAKMAWKMQAIFHSLSLSCNQRMGFWRLPKKGWLIGKQLPHGCKLHVIYQQFLLYTK